MTGVERKSLSRRAFLLGSAGVAASIISGGSSSEASGEVSSEKPSVIFPNQIIKEMGGKESVPVRADVYPFFRTLNRKVEMDYPEKVQLKEIETPQGKIYEIRIDTLSVTRGFPTGRIGISFQQEGIDKATDWSVCTTAEELMDLINVFLKNPGFSDLGEFFGFPFFVNTTGKPLSEKYANVWSTAGKGAIREIEVSLFPEGYRVFCETWHDGLGVESIGNGTASANWFFTNLGDPQGVPFRSLPGQELKSV